MQAPCTQFKLGGATQVEPRPNKLHEIQNIEKGPKLVL